MSKIIDTLLSLVRCKHAYSPWRQIARNSHARNGVFWTRYCSKCKTRQTIPAVCGARQYSDLTICKACGLSWDTNDPHPPKCPAMERQIDI